MSRSSQTARVFRKRFTRIIEANYLLYLPSVCKSDPARLCPLILFLHGSGERGSDIRKVATLGPPRIVRHREDFPFIVVSPQCPAGRTWSNDILLALLDEVAARHPVDPGRIYLTGLSMGGFGAWNLGIAHPERFAALAPICGGGDTIGIMLAGRSQARALKNLPVWAFHGAQDTVVKLEESERMVNALKALGSKEAQLTVYPELGHDSWTKTYQDERLYEWFLKHKRRTSQ